MFYQPASSRSLLTTWVKEILEGITYDSNDRIYLDEISASEVIDLTYLEGSILDDAIAANALFPRVVEATEQYRGMGANSTMRVVFPVNVDENKWGCQVRLRAGLPSILAIGRKHTYPLAAEPKITLPNEITHPNILNTQYQVQEASGNRLRALAGPLYVLDTTHFFDINAPSGTEIVPVIISEIVEVYGYIDDQQTLRTNTDQHGNLHSLDTYSTGSYYLQRKVAGCSLHLEFSWERVTSEQVRITVSLQNRSDIETPTRNDIILRTLILPHLQISLKGAIVSFPAQQYAQVKQNFITLSEEEFQQEAARRLYQVRQAGCIATVNPKDDSQVSLTTFGVFDTPREIPAPGPKISEVTQSLEIFLQACNNHTPEFTNFVTAFWSTLSNILQAAGRAFRFDQFHRFQWDAIVTGIELKATGRERAVTIVRAPTGSGKTIVFMVNAAIAALCGKQRSTSVLLFPTRILNEDMFRRLTTFIYQMRQFLSNEGVTGGLLMGESDPLYRLVLKPSEGEPLHYFGGCPACGHTPLTAQKHVVASENDSKMLPTCPNCGQIVNYMYNPREVSTFLPDIIIATPDKLFHTATVKAYENYSYGLFGAPVRYCLTCGRKYTSAGLTLKPEKQRCSDVFSDSKCSGAFSSQAISKPIRYMGFDEVHSLYGESATYLSVFLSTLEAMQKLLSGENNLFIRYETATATVANETQLLEAITRKTADNNEIIPIPSTAELANYFVIQPTSVRYRVLANMPSRISSKQAFLRSVLNSHLHLKGRSDQAPDLKYILEGINPSKSNSWDFLLGYVFKKQDGFDFQRSLRDFYRNRYNQTLNIDFLSGEAPKNKISEIIHKALSGQLDLLLANLVISLGIDIQDLNHMIMFGVPKGFTEYVQTAGRTGRGSVSGHVNIILLPAFPRDVYLYRHFHAVLSDVSGYYDALPVKSTNLHCSEQIFGNVSKAILTAFCMREPRWANNTGLNYVITKMGRNNYNQGLGSINGGISRILCNDETLRADTNNIVLTKSRRLFQELRTRNEFLSKVMTDSLAQWLIFSLRGRANNIVRVNSIDQTILDLITTTNDPDYEETDELVEVSQPILEEEVVVSDEEDI
jgi:hypothetical protein